MAKGWKCARCSTQNDETTITCSNCGLLRGSAVIPTSYGPSPGWQTSSQDPLAGVPPGPQPSDPTRSQSNAPPSPGPAGWDAPAPAPTPLWRRIPIGWAIVAVLVFGGSIAGAIFNASRAPTGEISKGGDLAAIDLRVGDCFDLKDPTADEIGDVTALQCTQPHQYEIFFVGSLPGPSYPSADELDKFIDDNCRPVFYLYVGKIYAESELEIFSLFPTNVGWAEGDRTVSCATHLGETRLTASVKGSKR
jgi:hypothetical protein